MRYQELDNGVGLRAEYLSPQADSESGSLAILFQRSGIDIHGIRLNEEVKAINREDIVLEENSLGLMVCYLLARRISVGKYFLSSYVLKYNVRIFKPGLTVFGKSLGTRLSFMVTGVTRR